MKSHFFFVPCNLLLVAKKSKKVKNGKSILVSQMRQIMPEILKIVLL
jgi:hypothetical protein